MREEFNQVKEFHRIFGHPIGTEPNMLEQKQARIRAQFMTEEIIEFVGSKDIYEQADAMIDLLYFTLGTLVEMGITPERLFAAVHDANMKKVWEDGTIHVDEITRKVLKPNTWTDPGISIRKIIDEMWIESKNIEPTLSEEQKEWSSYLILFEQEIDGKKQICTMTMKNQGPGDALNAFIRRILKDENILLPWDVYGLINQFHELTGCTLLYIGTIDYTYFEHEIPKIEENYKYEQEENK